MIRLIKFILSLFDYFTEKKILTQLKENFKEKKTISVIDIGAHKGEFISGINKNFVINKAYCFEPNPNIFQILQKKYLYNKKFQLLNFGASNIADNISFYENIESSSSSINELNTDSKYYKKKFFILNFFGSKKEVVNKIKVKVITLYDFLIENKINNIDLLKIDTEGHEYQVLKGLGDKFNIINSILLEHHFDDMLIKNYKLSNIHDLLIENGFKKRFKVKMKFRKSFEYLYVNKNFLIE